ncbi:MAG: hypothetical protein IT158_11895 [Bryobacterales bacterium]|nr:hypothetical protein [Bryobacterales bacterium]
MFAPGPAQVPAQGEPPGAPRRPPTGAAPGEFTRLFQAGGEPDRRAAESAAQPSPAPAPLRPPAAGSEPGDFTRFFESPLGTGSLAGKDLSRDAAPPPSRDAAPPPGEYTRLFKAPAEARPPSPGSGATRVFSAGGTPETAAEPRVEEGPSEFTRVIQASPAPAAPAAGPAAVHTGQASRPLRSGVPVWLIVFFALLGLMAAALILYFALKAK